MCGLMQMNKKLEIETQHQLELKINSKKIFKIRWSRNDVWLNIFINNLL